MNKAQIYGKQILRTKRFLIRMIIHLDVSRKQFRSFFSFLFHFSHWFTAAELLLERKTGNETEFLPTTVLTVTANIFHLNQRSKQQVQLR